jgi:hypothetical protein
MNMKIKHKNKDFKSIFPIQMYVSEEPWLLEVGQLFLDDTSANIVFNTIQYCSQHLTSKSL